MTGSAHTYTAEIVGRPDLALRDIGGGISLDEGRSPHVDGSLEIALPDAETMSALDPREGARVRITADATFPTMNQHRVFDLALRRRPIRIGAARVGLALASDEALLEDVRAASDDTGPRAHEASLRGVVNYVLGESITLRRNLFRNPWSVFPAGVIGINGELTTSNASGQLRIAHNNGATAGGDYVVHPLGDMEPGEAYGIRIELANVTGALNVAATLRTGAGVVLMTLDRTVEGTTHVLTGSYTAGDVAPTSPLVLIDVLGTGTGEAFTLAFSICEPGVTVAGPYFDGGTDPSHGTKYDGTPNASASRQTAYLAPGPDADVTAYWELVNLVTNPNCQNDTTGWFTITPNATLSRSPNGGPNGHPHRISTAVGSGIVGNQWTGTGAAGASFVAAARGSTRYTASMPLRASVNGKTARVVMRFTNGQQYVDMLGPLMNPTNTGWNPAYVIADCPPGFTGVSLYCIGYDFTGGQQLYDADAMITEGGEVVPTFKGSTPDDAHYNYEFSGTPDGSASRRIPVIERDPASLTWKAGQSAMEFLHPLVQSAGFRLVCDESRTWTLRDESFNAGIETLTIAHGINLIDGDDVIDLDAGLWFDAQSTLYRDPDVDGPPHVDYYELHPNPVRVNLVEIDGPYPGPGRSEYAVRRAQGRGREVTATTVADWRTKAEQTVQVILTTAPKQIGETSRVQFDLSRDEMTITTRTTEIPDGAIDLLVGTIDSLVGTIDSLGEDTD